MSHITPLTLFSNSLHWLVGSFLGALNLQKKSSATSSAFLVFRGYTSVHLLKQSAITQRYCLQPSVTYHCGVVRLLLFNGGPFFLALRTLSKKIHLQYTQQFLLLSYALTHLLVSLFIPGQQYLCRMASCVCPPHQNVVNKHWR